MFDFIKKYKIVIIAVSVDLFLSWLLYYSGFILPFISPSIEQYQHSGTSFPRNFNQIILWTVLHAPTSIVIGIFEFILRWIPYYEVLAFILYAAQTGIIAYYLEKHYHNKKLINTKS